MEREEVVGRWKERRERQNEKQQKCKRRVGVGEGLGRVKMKRGLMRLSRTTRDFSSHLKPGHITRASGTIVSKWEGQKSSQYRSLHAYLSFSAAWHLKVATFKQPMRRLICLQSLYCSLDRRATVTSKSICKLSRRNNILLSVEDEWPTFLLCYSHLILPLSPLTVALTDYTWQRLDERRWWLGACFL